MQFEVMVYKQIVGIPMGTKCVPLIADLFLVCYESELINNMNHMHISGTELKLMPQKCENKQKPKRIV